MDIYGTELVPNTYTNQVTVEMALPEKKDQQEKSIFSQFVEYMSQEPIELQGEEKITEAPIAYSYSLYYVYYD